MSDILFPTLSPVNNTLDLELLNSAHTSFPEGLTGLTNASNGLHISTIKDGETTPVVYSADAGNIETISAIGTYTAPSNGKCRFREVDSVSQPGLYHIQLDNSRYANTRRLVVNVYGTANLIAQKRGIQMGTQEITGPHLVTVSVTNDITPIADAGVFLLNADSSALLANRRTDDTGAAQFSIPSGTYNLRLIKSGVNFDPSYPVIVENSDVQVSIEGAAVSSTGTDGKWVNS